ncbi:MAG TPA: DUF308 domain-containing protein [Edaphobacter sp.]|jgi:uncharacterized membrane protein HdeD (DUF308 family)|nr:DUF308 domain-containing protein [Edaphobacter sp.]
MNSEPAPLSVLAPKAIGWSIALSLLLILAGIFAILIPFLSSIGITIIFAWAMIFSAITHFIFAFKTHTTGGRIWELLVSAVYLVTGCVLLRYPLDGLFVLTLVIAYYLFFEGIVEIIQYFQIHPRHGAVWLLIDGIVTLILAIMIWRSWPASTVWVVGTLVGISMILSGLSRLMLSLAAKRVLAI